MSACTKPQIGDSVSFDGKTGTVESLSTKRIRGVQTVRVFIRTEDGNMHMQFSANTRKIGGSK